MKSAYIYEFVAGTSLMVAMYSVFVGIFFFTYGAYVEHKSLEKQIDNIVGSLTRNIKPFIPPGVTNKIIAQIPNASTIRSSMQSADSDAAKNNKQVKKNAVEMLAGISIIGIGVAGLLAAFFPEFINLKTLFKKNLTLLVFVAVVEFLFFTLVTENYLSVDPNVVKGYIVNAVEKKTT
jgi:hypothetical protein